MEKSKRKELESKLKNIITAALRNIDIGAAIKSEKQIKEATKEIAKKFGKAVGDGKKKLSVAKPLTFKRAPIKKKAKVAVKRKKK